MNFEIIWTNLDYLLWGTFPQGAVGGVLLTLLISLLSVMLSTFFGILLGIGLTVLKSGYLRGLSLFLGFLRAIPVIMLIFWTYFLLPVLFNIDVPALATVVFALSLIGSAYIAHSVHAGMQAIARDQWQAAFSLGLRKRQVVFLIILPQALRIMLPSFINQWISLIKDSSLAYIVGVGEFTFLATQINNRSMVYPMEVFLFVIVVYFLICFVFDVGLSWLNRHLNRNLAR